MKAKLTKVLSLVLVVIMALSLMTGCSTSSSGKGTKTQDGNKVSYQDYTTSHDNVIQAFSNLLNQNMMYI